MQAQLKPRSLRRFLANLLVLTMTGTVISLVIIIIFMLIQSYRYNITSFEGLISDFTTQGRIWFIIFGAGIGAYPTSYAFLFGRVQRLRRWMHYGLAYGLGYMLFCLFASLISWINGNFSDLRIADMLFLSELGFGIVIGAVVLALYGDRVTSAERLGWSWSWRWMSLILLLVIVLLIPVEIIGRWTTFTYFLELDNSVLTHKIYPHYFDAADNLQHWQLAFDGTKSTVLESDLPIMVLVLLSAVMGGGVIGGLSKQESIEQRTRPNQGIRRSIVAALKTSLGFGLAGMIISGIAIVALYFTTPPKNADNIVLSELVTVAVIVGLMAGMALGLLFAGTDTVIKHSLLRWMLWRNGSIPWNYNRFLGYAADRIFLRRVGGGFIYVHRYLLEHFARRNTTPAWLTQRIQRRRLPATAIFALLPIFYLGTSLLLYGVLKGYNDLRDSSSEIEVESSNADSEVPTIGACPMEFGVPYHVESGNLDCDYTVNTSDIGLAIEVFADNSRGQFIGNLTITSLATDERLVEDYLYNSRIQQYKEVWIGEAGTYHISLDLDNDFTDGYGILLNIIPFDDLAIGYNSGRNCRGDCYSRFEAEAGDFVLLQYNTTNNNGYTDDRMLKILDPNYIDVNPYCLVDDCPGQTIRVGYYHFELTPNIYNGTGECSSERYISDIWGGTILPISSSGWYSVILGRPYSPSKYETSYDSLRLQVLEPNLTQVGVNSGSINELVPAQVWQYTGVAGETLTISTTADWDTQLSLFSPDYDYLLHNDDVDEVAPLSLCSLDYLIRVQDIMSPNTLNSRLVTTLEESGSYYIVVSSFENMTHGDYTLTIDSTRE